MSATRDAHPVRTPGCHPRRPSPAVRPRASRGLVAGPARRGPRRPSPDRCRVTQARCCVIYGAAPARPTRRSTRIAGSGRSTSRRHADPTPA
ncbi:MAG: hypothetical protein AMS20_09620 [Gemmatimonas sp. SG8_28]|nr:MAG: hypothetical protein AMS20_09620 [Gemmatimonas sp. SG8_28]